MKRLAIMLLLLLVIQVLILAPALRAANCGDFIRGLGGAVNPTHISYIVKVHNSSEIADGTNWEYQSYFVMNNGTSVLYTQSHYEGYIDEHIDRITSRLNECKAK